MNVFGDWNVPRTRAVGHDDMLDAVSSPNIPNGLGYAFYSIGTFSKRNHINYLTVDGVDPLYGTPSGGVFPLCTGFLNSTPMFSCAGTTPTFANIAEATTESGRFCARSPMQAILRRPVVPAFPAGCRRRRTSHRQAFTTFFLISTVPIPHALPRLWRFLSCTPTTTSAACLRTMEPLPDLLRLTHW